MLARRAGEARRAAAEAQIEPVLEVIADAAVLAEQPVSGAREGRGAAGRPLRRSTPRVGVEAVVSVPAFLALARADARLLAVARRGAYAWLACAMPPDHGATVNVPARVLELLAVLPVVAAFAHARSEERSEEAQRRFQGVVYGLMAEPVLALHPCFKARIGGLTGFAGVGILARAHALAATARPMLRAWDVQPIGELCAHFDVNFW